jgi:hypothetical protein
MAGLKSMPYLEDRDCIPLKNTFVKKIYMFKIRNKKMKYIKYEQGAEFGSN